jgi:hypothetical protein
MPLTSHQGDDPAGALEYGARSTGVKHAKNWKVRSTPLGYGVSSGYVPQVAGRALGRMTAHARAASAGHAIVSLHAEITAPAGSLTSG